jgi:hypothetical protein
VSAVLFDLATLRGLTAGQVDRTYRRWEVVRPRVGSRFTTRAGVVEVTSIDLIDPAELTDHDAARAGFGSRASLLTRTDRRRTGDLYAIGIRLAGPDPRIELRNDDQLEPAELAGLSTKLARMDAAAAEPWTLQSLRLIERSPGIVSTVLAAEAGQERGYFKLRIRRLKALGLTESLEVGYRLSPRGAAYLASQDE